MLQKIIGSHARAEILKSLFTDKHPSFHLRELARHAQLSAPVLQRELRQLTALGLVVPVKDGNRLNFTAAQDHPLFYVLCDLVSKTDGIEGALKTALDNEAIECAFIFGSIAKGTATAQSDIDVFIIGNLGLRDVTRMTHSAVEQIGREINPYVITKDDFIKRRNQHDHFISEVLNTPKIFLKGSADELNAMEN